LVGTDYLALVDSPQAHAQWVDRLKRANKIGITMAYGTDATGQRPGETRGTEAIAGIDVWNEAGIPANVLLKAMTVNAARLLGVDAVRGNIRKGLAADIIAVMKNGAIIKR
jgi:imidazolonepropionase-like amidohydrolase